VKPQLIEDYVEPGLVSLEYRDFAHLGEETIRAAEGAACAADQDPDAYWDFNETLYQNQHTPPANGGGYSDSRLAQMADELGLDVDEFESCMDDETFRDEIEASTEEAQDIGISGTPGFQINGEATPWEDYETLAAEIDAALDAEE
jgi:protein-disulfide isomerase